MVTQRLVFHGLESALWVTALGLVLIGSIACVVILFRLRATADREETWQHNCSHCG